jgi:MFS family permease
VSDSAPYAPALQGAVPPSRRGVRRYLYASTSFWGISVGLLSGTLPFRFEQLGLPIFEYGLTLSVYAASMLPTESLWGAVAFRLGRPSILIALGVVAGGATLLLGYAHTFPMILGAEVVLGAVGVYLAPVLRWVSFTYGGPGSEGTGTGRWSSMYGLGIAVGLAIGPVGFVAFGFRDVAFESLGMLAVSVAAAAALPWARVALPQAVRGRGLALKTVATRPFLIAIGLVVIMFTGMTFTTNFLQYYSTVLFGGTTSDAGYVLGAARLVSLAAAFLLGTLVDRWGARRSIPAGFLLMLLGGLATWAARSYDDMVAATMVFSAGIGWLSASLLPLAMSSMPRDHQGTAIGVFGSMEDLGLLVGPLLFGAAWAAYGPTSLFPLVTALAALGVMASVLVAFRPTWTFRSEAGKGPIAREPE